MFLSKQIYICNHKKCSKDNVSNSKCLEHKKCLVNLDIWDTAGQERFAKMLQLYYRGASIIVLVFALDDLESFEKIKILFDEISELNTAVKVILVGTKYDLCSDFDQKTINNFVNDHKSTITNFVVTSSKTNYGIDILTNEIHKIIKDINMTMHIVPYDSSIQDKKTSMVQGFIQNHDDISDKACCSIC
jgi:small GTP-binding protein